jgi:hypothetical protein
MDIATVVSEFNRMLLQLSSVFTAPSAETFRQLVVGWLLTPGPGPVTGMVRALGAEATKHWTVYEKFFYRAAWSVEDLGQQVLGRLVAPLLGPTVDLNIDDTTCGPRGRHVALAGWFRDASAKAQTTVIHWAHQWLIGAVTVRVPRWPLQRLALPVLFALYRKKADCDRTHPYATLPQLAARMVRQAADALPGKRIFVATDGLYATREFFGDLPPGVCAVTRLRKNAALRCWPVPPRKGCRGGRPRVRGDRLPPLADLFRNATDWRPVTLLKQGRKVRRLIHGLTCQWYHVCRSNPVRVVLVRDPSGVEDDLAVACTDLAVADAAVVQRQFDRWGIEECIEEAKQQMGMERTRGWCAATVSRQAPLALILVTLVKLWYVQHGADQPGLAPEVPPWYAHKRGPSLRDMRAALRRAFWQHCVFDKLLHGCKYPKLINALTFALCEAA